MKSSAAKKHDHAALHLEVPPLPYAEDALAPIISKETLAFHHGKHHRKYVETTNQLLEKGELHAHSLEEVVRGSSGKLFNNAAQAWNHDFYWRSLSPERAKPSAAFLAQLESDFGGQDRFQEQFATAAAAQFGSAWAWLTWHDAKLEIVTT